MLFIKMKNNIHILDEYTFPIIMKELDTITDFVSYFMQKEELLNSGKLLFIPSETELLTMFLSNMNEDKTEHCFLSVNILSSNIDKIVINNLEDPYPQFTQTQEYKNKKEDDEISYFWDDMINSYSTEALNGNLIKGYDFLGRKKLTF